MTHIGLASIIGSQVNILEQNNKRQPLIVQVFLLRARSLLVGYT